MLNDEGSEEFEGKKGFDGKNGLMQEGASGRRILLEGGRDKDICEKNPPTPISHHIIHTTVSVPSHIASPVTPMFAATTQLHRTVTYPDLNPADNLDYDTICKTVNPRTGAHPFVSVRRVDYNTLTTQQLIAEVRRVCIDAGEPLVIENVHKAATWKPELFTLDWLVENAPDLRVEPRNVTKRTNFPEITLADYIAYVRDPKQGWERIRQAITTNAQASPLLKPTQADKAEPTQAGKAKRKWLSDEATDETQSQTIATANSHHPKRFLKNSALDLDASCTSPPMTPQSQTEKEETEGLQSNARFGRIAMKVEQPVSSPAGVVVGALSGTRGVPINNLLRKDNGTASSNTNDTARSATGLNDADGDVAMGGTKETVPEGVDANGLVMMESDISEDEEECEVEEEVVEETGQVIFQTNAIRGPGNVDSHQQASITYIPTNIASVDEDEEKPPKLYGKDIDCPKRWSQYVGYELFPSWFVSMRENDLFDASAFWFMARTADKDKAAHHWRSLGESVDVDTYLASVAQLATVEDFQWVVVEQRLGDFVLVPSESVHQVINKGGVTIKVSWNRITAETLRSAYYSTLPLYKSIFRPETYNVKAIIFHTLQRWCLSLTDFLRRSAAGDADAHTCLPLTIEGQVQFGRDLRTLVELYGEMIKEEWVEDFEWQGMMWRGDGFISQEAVTDETDDDVTMRKSGSKNGKAASRLNVTRVQGGLDHGRVCDFCKSDIWNRLYHCGKCTLNPPLEHEDVPSANADVPSANADVPSTNADVLSANTNMTLANAVGTSANAVGTEIQPSPSRSRRMNATPNTHHPVSLSSPVSPIPHAGSSYTPNEDGDGYDLCLDCYATGRTCRHLTGMRMCESMPIHECVTFYQEAVGLFNRWDNGHTIKDMFEKGPQSVVTTAATAPTSARNIPNFATATSVTRPSVPSAYSRTTACVSATFGRSASSTVLGASARAPVRNATRVNIGTTSRTLSNGCSPTPVLSLGIGGPFPILNYYLPNMGPPPNKVMDRSRSRSANPMSDPDIPGNGGIAHPLGEESSGQEPQPRLKGNRARKVLPQNTASIESDTSDVNSVNKESNIEPIVAKRRTRNGICSPVSISS
ncbi:hypothetical protein BC936DRAFT_144762 [Jimgerdemannia flammicorona]|uniref:JmjC domain-containing protein n=1 Tax=Jimgerdemannia flammicorona TaxID=994334 RepID=A0A433DBQ3_9FUNG|nr:hypothetical protein BC936DRAFT_144762 [Jimgerdemannia flammicorona]